MKKGEVYEGTVRKVLFPNKGLLEEEGERIIVKNVMPGQKIRFRIIKKRQNRLEGRLLEVLEQSPLESTAPKCSCFPDCGGCMYQTMEYSAQLSMKEAQVRELLQEGIEGSAVFRGITPSPAQWAYRNKMEYTFGDAEKNGPLTLGLHKKGSNFDILPATDCVLVHEDLNRIVTCVLAYCREEKLPYYHRMSHEGFLRHLLVRRAEATGQILAAIVTTTQRAHDFSELTRRLTALPLSGELTGFLHMENDSVADVVRTERTHLLYGRDFIEEELLGLKFRISPFSFFQTNTRGAEVLYRTAREMIGDIDDAVVFDLYSGTGTIAQVLAPAAGRVIGVEIVEEAVEAAKENARQNGLTNCTFLAGDVLKMLDEIPETPDYLVLDPPREGIHPKALEKIIAYRAARIVYISCKPTSLARDLEAFLAGGYQVQEIRCVDMFPGTVHVETVCLLSNRKPDSYVHLNLKMEDYYRIKDAEKEQGKK